MSSLDAVKQIHKSSYLSFSKSDLLKVSFFKVSKELKSLSFRERWVTNKIRKSESQPRSLEKIGVTVGEVSM